MLNQEKVELRKKSVKFVGHIISNGVQPGEDKLDAIKKFRSPASPEELRSFLGLVSYLGSFIKDLATRAAPLRRLVLESKEKFVWEESHEKCFKALKDSVVTDIKLSFFDAKKQTRVIVDASPVDLGAVLCQRDLIGQDTIVMFASKTLSGPETRYCQTEKEVVTDHKPLTYIFHPTSKPCPRIERWVLRLQPFEFLVVHESGKSNIADPLSRMSATDPNPESFDEDSDHYVNEVESMQKLGAVTLREIKDAGEKDEEFEALKQAMQSGQWQGTIGKWKPYAGEFGQYQDMIIRGNRVYIPESLRERVLTGAHEGHPGRDKMVQRLREKVWWPSMTIDAERTYKACKPCTMVSLPNPPVPMKKARNARWPMEGSRH